MQSLANSHRKTYCALVGTMKQRKLDGPSSPPSDVTIPNEMVICLGMIIAAHDGPVIIYGIRPDPFSGIQHEVVGALWARDNGTLPLGARVLWTAGAEPYWGYATILRYWVEAHLLSN